MSRRSQSRRPWAKRSRLAGAAALSIGAHAAVALAALLTWSSPPTPRKAPAIDVALIALPPPPVVEPPSAAPSLSPPAPAPSRRALVRPTASAADVPPLPIAPSTAPPGPPSDGLSDADLAGAATAGSGAGSGGCDMAQRVEAALRRDPLVKAAVARTDLEGVRAIRVWNGDWVQSGAEDGKGLSAVREAITWEVAFAPAPCRTQAMHGLVLLTASETPGATRLALGSPAWRWSDLLGVR